MAEVVALLVRKYFKILQTVRGNNSDPLSRSSDVGASGNLYANSVIGTFTADGNSQDIWISGAVDAGISAYVLTSTVPEPSSAMLVLMGCLGLAARRRV